MGFNYSCILLNELLSFQDPGSILKAQSTNNIDISSKYPTLQHSKFYKNLYKKYPQAFQRKISSPDSILHKDKRPPRSSRRVFNSGLRVHFEDEILSDNRSVCSEIPLSSRLKYENESEDSWTPRQYRDCRTSPTPSMVSDSSVKQRLSATSEQLRHLLSASPFHHRVRHGYSDYDLDTLVTPRHLENRSRKSRSHYSSSSTLTESYSQYGDSDSLSTPRYNDMHDTSQQRLAREERILQLERELEMKDIELQAFREKLEFERTFTVPKDTTHKNTQEKMQDIHRWNLTNSASPPDSAIDVDISSNFSTNEIHSDYQHEVHKHSFPEFLEDSDLSITNKVIEEEQEEDIRNLDEPLSIACHKQTSSTQQLSSPKGEVQSKCFCIGF